ncbi:MAG TPA: hypothetical protein VL443_25475 [Cyclobacteriaceae bacterium]|nr:hypothetical protein [Cyclobacteriaceae bacterium]
MLTLLACSRVKPLNIQVSNGLTLIDSTSVEKDLSFSDTLYEEGYYPVYYIGPDNDTIILEHEPISMFFNPKDSIYYKAKNWESLKNMEISLAIDTNMTVAFKAGYSHFDENAEEVLDSVKNFAAYVIKIKNNSDSLVQLGSHNAVGYLTKEAKNNKGDWIQIEEPIKPYCGTAKKQLIMEPGDILITKMIKHKANLKVECRLKLRLSYIEGTYVTYSNTFVDQIDTTQIKLPLD